jgi:glucose-6-phosphate isomerase
MPRWRAAKLSGQSRIGDHPPRPAQPDRLGALLAFYEARTFTAAVMMGLNPFDQWGVELGKQVANQAVCRGNGRVRPIDRWR